MPHVCNYYENFLFPQENGYFKHVIINKFFKTKGKHFMGECVYPTHIVMSKEWKLNENIIFRLMCMENNKDLSQRNGRWR